MIPRSTLEVLPGLHVAKTSGTPPSPYPSNL